MVKEPPATGDRQVPLLRAIPGFASADAMATTYNYKADLAFLDDKRGPMTESLRSWCAINSGSSNLTGLKAMHGTLAEAFAALGAEVETVPSRPHQIVTREGDVIEQPVGDMLRLVKRPQAPVRVLLAGHMDTVFPADHPFQG